MNREIIDVLQKNAEVSQSVASLRLVVERIYVEVSQVSQILLKKGLFWHSGY